MTVDHRELENTLTIAGVSCSDIPSANVRKSQDCVMWRSEALGALVVKILESYTMGAGVSEIITW